MKFMSRSSGYRGRGPRRSTPEGAHRPIMVEEILRVFHLKPGDKVADLTLGHGGHTEHFLRTVGTEGTVLAMDLDFDQAQITLSRLQEAGFAGRLLLETGNFAGIGQAMGKFGLPAMDAILADLGISSMQIDKPERGFSYRREGPLDMRMDPRRGETARGLLTTISAEDLASGLEEFGDVPLAGPMARAMLSAHRVTPFETTTQLAEFCLTWHRGTGSAQNPGEWRLRQGKKKWETHPAARVFQALRIMVNREIANLKHLLRVASDLLAPGGTLAILSFHSGEDRLVKSALEQGLRQGKYAEINEGPIRATFEERTANPRSRSAKLRWARRPLTPPEETEAGDT